MGKADDDGKNWFDGDVDEVTGEVESKSELCLPCGYFTIARGISESDLIEAKQKEGKVANPSKHDLEEFHSVFSGEDKEFDGKEVRLVSRTGGFLEEPAAFVDRAAFKALHVGFPDEVGLCQGAGAVSI